MSSSSEQAGTVTYALIRSARLDLDSFARATGTHPELIRRLAALGLLEARTDPAGNLWLPPSQIAALARLERLRAGFAINYAALGLVVDLLDRVAALEAELRVVSGGRAPGPALRGASGGRPPGPALRGASGGRPPGPAPRRSRRPGG